MVRETRCIVCGGEKPFSRLKYCDKCALRIRLKQSRDKKREYRLMTADYDKGDRLDFKKAWRERHKWNKYMKEYRREHPDRIRGQNRDASRRYRKRASVKRNIPSTA